MNEVADTTNDPKARAEAISLANTIKNYQFLVTLATWYELLVQVNAASKLMQQKNMQLDVTITILEKTLKFLREFREEGFEKSLIIARELAEELEMNPSDMVFPNEGAVRPRRVRKQFSYEADDESVNLNPTDKFRTTFFLVLLDNAIASFSQRFEQMQEFQKNFGFLFTFIHNRCSINEYEMKANCLNLQTVLSSKSQSQNQSNTLCSDIDSISLFDELKALHNIMPDNISSILELLRFLHFNCLHEVFPTVSVALRVLLTIPITVASGERSFSTLKLIKTYLRASMKQDRLNGLALLSIEKSVAKELNYTSLIRKFASIKARRVSF